MGTIGDYHSEAMNVDASHKLYGQDACRALDQAAISELGVTGFQLMQRAGEAAFDSLFRHWPNATSIAVYCGAGNNGGDGYIVATLALKAGLDVTTFATNEPSTETAHAAFCQFLEQGGRVTSWPPESPVDSEVLVDALFGTGLKRAPSGVYADMVYAINRSKKPVLSLDIPSGIAADSGAAYEPAVRANVTLTFVGNKLGLYTGAGRVLSGVVEFDRLGITDAIYQTQAPLALRITESMVADRLPEVPIDAHKGTMGHVLVVGGHTGMLGAVIMSAEAAARSGAGLVTIATNGVHCSEISVRIPEVMTREIDNDVNKALIKGVTVVAIGPGLGRDDWGKRTFDRISKFTKKAGATLVVDADGLNRLSVFPEQNDHWILTPHPGEAAQLLQTTTAHVGADRPQAARDIASQYGGICILKGAGTLVAIAPESDLTPDQPQPPLYLCEAGNSGMASGGMGDVLAGVVAAFAAQGLPLLDAALVSVWLHATAADIAAKKRSRRGLLATDLAPEISRLLSKFEH